MEKSLNQAEETLKLAVQDAKHNSASGQQISFTKLERQRKEQENREADQKKSLLFQRNKQTKAEHCVGLAKMLVVDVLGLKG